MTKRDSTYAVFIDYDNLLPAHKRAGILDVVTKALIQIPMDAVTTRAKCDVRVYGGWYEGTQITRMAEYVTVEIQRDFPKIIRLPTAEGGHVAVSANAELAVALLQEPGHHLFNTYRRKGKPANVRVEEPTVVGCTDPACVLPLMKKLLKTGNCPRPGCSVTVGDLVYRHEQKIVDTMLSCDLILSASAGHDRVILVSGDDDFLPPLRTISLHGAAAVRFHPKPNYQPALFPQGGALLLEKDL
ncbi:MAG: NYN domain-containing protein [Burkholderiaceae bacterium]|nr:NYN domain-containing protein [Burkholderiaceae bacterium]